MSYIQELHERIAALERQVTANSTTLPAAAMAQTAAAEAASNAAISAASIAATMAKVVESSSAQKSFTHSPKVALPEKYNGDRRKYREFICAVENVFSLQPERFTSEEVRCRFLGSLLTFPASSWFSSLLEKRSPLLNSWMAFVHDFETNFADPNRVRQAQLALKKLKQGRDAAAIYTAKFRRLAGDTGYNESALREAYRSGLCDDIKDALASSVTEPEDLEDFIRFCQQIDNRQFERRMERHTHRHPGSSNQKAHTKPNYGLAPMEIDSATLELDKKKAQFSSTKKLTNDERARRFREGLCLYCAESGHRLADCPKKKMAKN